MRLRTSEEWPPAWHRVDALEPLAFDNNEVIAQAVERVRAKLEYTNIAYGLLPEQFTLRELQSAYGAIEGATLDRRFLALDKVTVPNAQRLSLSDLTTWVQTYITQGTEPAQVA